MRLSHLVDAVLDRLTDAGVHGTRLADEWDVIRRSSSEEEAFCPAAARLGLDPYAEGQDFEEDILAASRALEDPQLLDDFLGAVDPSQIPLTLDWVSKAQEEIESFVEDRRTDSDVLRELRAAGESLASAERLPWLKGWESARRVREVLSLADTSPIAPEEFLPSKISPDASRGLQGFGGQASGGHDAVLVMPRAQPLESKRFTLSRALFRIISGDSARFLVTSARTDRQKIERAFAAELLAPASGIARKLGGDVLAGMEEDVIEEIAEEYGVSTLLVRHQIDNQLVGQA